MGKPQKLLLATAFAVLGQCNFAHAAAPAYTFDQPTSCGTWCYHDASYTKLTDGVVGNQGWAYNAGAEWVGWLNKESVNITFQFDSATTFSSVSVGSTQDSLTDVVLPSFALWAYVGGSWTLQGNIVNPASSGNNSDPYAGGPHPVFTFSGLNVTTDLLRLTATSNVPGTWMFVDEVSFNAAPVPEPSTWAMLLTGVGLLCWSCRDRSGVKPVAYPNRRKAVTIGLLS